MAQNVISDSDVGVFNILIRSSEFLEVKFILSKKINGPTMSPSIKSSFLRTKVIPLTGTKTFLTNYSTDKNKALTFTKRKLRN